MGKLIYSMITSLDGYAIDADGGFDFAIVDEEAHVFIGEQMRSVGTFLYGRRMYETMVFWETVDRDPAAPGYIVDFARDWQAADKIVYSSTLREVASGRTRIERSFDPESIRALTTSSDSDVTISGPELAAHAIRAGLVDEYQLILGPRVVGGGTPFFPSGSHLDLELVDEHHLSTGSVWLRYLPSSR